MKPSTLRYLHNEQDVWALLWRLIPKACRELMNSKHSRQIRVNFHDQQPQSINIKHI